MKQKGYSVTYRWLAFLLCLALCMGSSPMQAYAAGMDITVTEAGPGSSDVMAGGDYEPHTDYDNSSPEKDTINDNTDTEAVSGNDTDDDGNAADSTEDTEDTEDEDTDAGDAPEDVVPPSDDSDAESPDGSDNGTESVSENDLAAVSGNDLQSVSENTLDEDLQARIDAAEEAFGRLLGGKDLMALLYHTDTYSARREPRESSESTAMLETGQTLYICGIRITEEDVWYETQFFVNGAEGTGYVQSYYLAYADEDWLAWEKEYLVPILESGEAYR